MDEKNKKETGRLFSIPMQFFAEDSGDSGDGGDGGVAKTFTQEEVDTLLNEKIADRLKQEKLQQRQTEKQKKEAEKLKTMSEEERRTFELCEKEKELEEKEKQLNISENKNEAAKILLEKGISLKLVDFVVADDADAMMANISLLEREFKASVKEEVEKRLKGSTPQKGLSQGADGISKDAFKKMSLSQQQALYTNNKELYEALVR